MPLAMNVVQSEKMREIPFTASDTGWVKRWFFTTPKDGGEDVYIHWKQLVGTKVLRQGVSCNTEYDKSKGRYMAINCTVEFVWSKR